MLQKIREKSSGWVAGIIVGLLVLTFALWGINSYVGQGGEPVVAVVNDTEITSSEFQRAFYNIRQQVQNITGQSIPADDPVFQQEALNRLIDNELMNQTTIGYGLRVSDQRVYETINSLETFKSGDQFDPALYQRTLTTLGMNESTFEQQIRLDMMSEQLQSAIAETAFTVPAEVERIATLREQTRDFDYAIIRVKSFTEGLEIPDSEIVEYYESNHAEFVQPEKIQVEYLDITVDMIAELITLSAEDYINYFNANRINYQVPERRVIWQAKIKAKEEFEGDAEAAVLEKAREIAEVFRSNDDFVQVGEMYSSKPDDPLLVSISESGEMKKGVLKQEIDDTLFAMETGTVSAPVKSGDAYHVIKLIAVLQAEEKQFEDVRDQVEKDYRREVAQRKYFDLAEQAAALSYEHPKTLQVAADAIEIEPKTTGFFTRESGEGLAAEARVREAAFSEEVLLNGNNSEPLELDPERMVILRLAERQAEGTRPLDEVREEIRDILMRQAAMQKVQETSQALLEKTGQGQPLAAAAGELGIEVDSLQAVTRDAIDVNRSVIRTAYRMAQSGQGKTAIENITLGNGDVAIIELKQINYSQDIKGKTIDAVKAELQRLRALTDWEGLFRQLRDDATIEVYQSNL